MSLGTVTHNCRSTERTTAANADQPLVLVGRMTADERARSGSESLSSGVEFLQKPFDFEALLRTVEEALDAN